MVRWLSLALVLLAQSDALPPAYPRPGTTSMLENARVLVWNIAWLKQAYPLHRHRYDLVGVYYTNGDRIIVSTEGARRPVSTAPWNIAFQASGVTHVEEGASDDPLRAVFVEMKEPQPRGGVLQAAADAFPAGAGTQKVDNPRTTAWEFLPSASAPMPAHRHQRDAVVVGFSRGVPSASYVTAGTSHRADCAAGAERIYVFELK